MAIPHTRKELRNSIQDSFSKLQSELDQAGPGVAKVACIDDWTIKDLLAVRVWWTESVAHWIQEGRQGRSPELPATGFSWRQTPELNTQIVRESREEAFDKLRNRLSEGFQEVLQLIDSLDDRELLSVGVYAWAGKWPVARWISINTGRQYTTARTFIRRALRNERRRQP